MPKKIARLAMLVALALVLGYVERLIPFDAPTPGVKLGLANLVTLVALYLFGWREALAVGALRALLGGLLYGSGFGIAYALAGALAALGAMAALKKTGVFHPVSVSAAGGVAHNLAQLLVAVGITHTLGILGYLPVLIGSGAATGILVGVAGSALIHRLRTDAA